MKNKEIDITKGENNMAYQVEKKNGYTLYHNENGKTIGTSSCPIIEVDGCVLKIHLAAIQSW